MALFNSEMEQTQFGIQAVKMSLSSVKQRNNNGVGDILYLLCIHPHE